MNLLHKVKCLHLNRLFPISFHHLNQKNIAMANELYFESTYGTVSFDTELQANLMIWTTPPSSREFREGMNKLADQINERGVADILTDTTHLGAIDPDDQVWSATTWTDRITKVSGRRKLALILPEEIFTQISVADTMAMVQDAVEMKYFSSLQEAKAWVKIKESKIVAA